MNIYETISNIGIIPVIAIDDAAQAVPLAKALAAGGLPAAEVTFRTAIFAGKAVECMKKPGRGAHGHIAIAANSVDRAVYHLGRQGVEFIEDSRVADAKGKTKAIYLKNEVSGFAIHLVQK